MQELRQAMKEGVRATLHATAGLPRRHPFAISGAALGLALILLFAGLFDVSNRVDVIHRDTTKLVHAANVCGNRSLSHPRRSRECANRLRNALLNCRRYEGCRKALLAANSAPVTVHPRRIHSDENSVSPAPISSVQGGDAQSPVHSHPGQPSGGGSPSPVKHPAPKPTSQPQPEPASAAPAPSPSPGHSDNKGIAGEHGVKQCVDVAVSACVKLEVP